jgi:hypothetical protein
VRLIAASADGEHAFWAAVDRMPDFDARWFARFVEFQRLGPWVAPVVTGARARREWPAEAFAILDEEVVSCRRRTAQAVADTLEIDEACERAGLDRLHLKGVAFGARHYPASDRRHQRDVDLLVRRRDLERAIEVLAGIGYAPEPIPTEVGVVRLGLHRGESWIDVHWNLRRSEGGRSPRSPTT